MDVFLAKLGDLEDWIEKLEQRVRPDRCELVTYNKTFFLDKIGDLQDWVNELEQQLQQERPDWQYRRELVNFTNKEQPADHRHTGGLVCLPAFDIVICLSACLILTLSSACLPDGTVIWLSGCQICGLLCCLPACF